MGLPPIEIRSEIGPLKRVLLHRPGRELENLMPEYIERLLFDDIPYLKIAQEEHDAFCHLLRQNGVEVVYLTDLVAESLADPAVKDQFLREYITEAGIWGEKRVGMMLDYFKTMSTKNMVEKMMEGVRKSEVRGYGKKNLTDYLDDYYPFVLDPIPNLYFTRDPFAAIDEVLAGLDTPNILVDFHAEATAEKLSMGFYLDGRVSAVIGTHTHVQTADERILSGGTAYLTDAGMCGSFDSVLGVKKELAVEKMRTQLPTRFENARGQGILWGCVIDIDEKTGRARSIERVADRVE